MDHAAFPSPVAKQWEKVPGRADEGSVHAAGALPKQIHDVNQQKARQRNHSYHIVGIKSTVKSPVIQAQAGVTACPTQSGLFIFHSTGFFIRTIPR